MTAVDIHQMPSINAVFLSSVPCCPILSHIALHILPIGSPQCPVILAHAASLESPDT